MIAERNPCLPGAEGPCVPYFYMLGAFHSGVRDLFDRLKGHEDVFVPSARGTCAPGKRCTGDAEAYPYYFTETHPWDRKGPGPYLVVRILHIEDTVQI